MELFTSSEFVHFSVNFPVEAGMGTAGRHDVGGPWSMLADGEWDGYPSGGMLVWGREGVIEVDLGKQGILKRLIQPNDLTLSSHWIRNVGAGPYSIKLEIDMCGLPVEWETFESFWDQKTRTATREIVPGKLYNMDWHVTIPPGRREEENICDGGLKVIDAGTDRLLTFLPIRIINSNTKTQRGK